METEHALSVVRWRVVGCGLVAAGLLLHCGGGFDEDGARIESQSTATGTATLTSGSNSTTGGSGPDAGEPPPEMELEGSFRAPVATGRYLWSANPESGRVAIIDTDVLDVQIADAGFGPTHLAAVPDADAVSQAIVINVLSHDATLFRLQEGELSTLSFPLHEAANRWAVAASGRWAAAWTDAREVEVLDPTDGFQDITLIDLELDQVTRLSVGYRPSQLRYDADEERLFAVTEPGISVIDLSGEAPEISDLVVVDPEGVGASDVSITPDGKTALVRTEGVDYLGVVELDDGGQSRLELAGRITDLDLSENGELAIAVVREASQIAIIDTDRLPEPDSVTTLEIPDQQFGSVALSPAGDVAVLFTNAVANQRATIVRLEPDQPPSYRSVDLKAPVRAMLVAPDGEHAIALLDVPAGSNKAGAFSVLVTKAERSPKIVGTEAPPLAVAFTPGEVASHAILTTLSDNRQVFDVHLIGLPSLRVDSLPLASPPLATGIMADQGLGYVAQSHPEGRVTFIDLSTANARTLTGFELATKVVD